MFSKIEVKGKDIHPLYQFLTEEERNGKVDADRQLEFSEIPDWKGRYSARFI